MIHSSASKKVLLAIRPVDLQAISNILSSEFDLMICYTLEQAIEHLDSDIAVIVCAIRFDQGSMFELLSAARANPNTSWVPYYLIIGENAKYSDSILEGIKKAATIKGVNGIFEFSKLVPKLGKEQTYERFRECLRSLLNSGRVQRRVNSTAFRSMPDRRNHYAR